MSTATKPKPGCAYDYTDEVTLTCVNCRTHSISLLIPATRAPTLACLLARGELRGKAEGEARAIVSAVLADPAAEVA